MDRSLRACALAVAAVLALLLAACGSREPPAILVPVYFYQGHTVGKESPPTGLQVSRDGGETFETTTWPEQITSSVAVGPEGKWLWLAAGNGVMVSRDGGKSWRLTGGFTMTEVQRVVPVGSPGQAYAATAYGLFLTMDGGETWKSLRHDESFRYVTDYALQETTEQQRLWAAADRGIFVSEDYGASWRHALARSPVRRLLVDRADPDRVLAATDGRGLVETRDGGKSFVRLEGTPDTTFAIDQDPHDPAVLRAGAMDGLFTSRDGGKTWARTSEGLPADFSVYGIAVDPEDGDHVVVSGSDGVFQSRDGGSTWRRLGFENAIVYDVEIARLADVPRDGPSAEAGGLEIPTGEAFDDFRPEQDPAAARKEAVADHFRALPPPKEGRFRGWFRAALAVRDGEADEALWDEVRAALDKPAHSMFFSLPAIGFYLHSRDALPDDLEERFREVLTETSFYRGDTENHWVMHYAALLLAAETWPQTPAARWYTGRTTQENHDEAKGWLLHWARLAATRGQGEFDSPNYLYMYVTPMCLLSDFAEDPEVRQMAGMMLDLLLADYFAESLRGAWCGGHSRIIGKEVTLAASNGVGAYHYLFAGGIERPEKIRAWVLFAAMSGYRPPRVLEAVANRRDEPYVHTEVKRVRNVIRHGRERNPPVYKYDYMTPDYCLGCLQGGILQPIQQHTWDVTWIGSAANTTFFGMHPAVSGRELSMFFPEEQRQLTKVITNQKGYYADPDKLVSASAFERVRQERNVLLALYRVPEGERFPHLNFHVPDCLETVAEGGWTIGRDGGFLVAWFVTAPGEWTQQDGYRRFRCPARRTGVAVIARPEGDFGLDRFRGYVRACSEPAIAGEGDATSLSFRLRDGSERKLVWGEPSPVPADKLFAGPFLESDVGTGVIRITDGTTTRTLDFNSLTVTETR